MIKCLPGAGVRGGGDGVRDGEHMVHHRHHHREVLGPLVHQSGEERQVRHYHHLSNGKWMMEIPLFLIFDSEPSLRIYIFSVYALMHWPRNKAFCSWQSSRCLNTSNSNIIKCRGMQRKFHYINNYMKNLYLKNSTSQASLYKPLLKIFSTFCQKIQTILNHSSESESHSV